MKDFANTGGRFIIGMAGGTGSGKSTLTNRLKDIFQDKITVLYHDNYYRRQDDKSFAERMKTNYDHPAALETELLVEHLRALRQGKAIQCPVYDFAQHNRSDRFITVEPSPIIIVEGILILQDSRLRDMFDCKIFVDVDADERILRRAMRDMQERGRSLDDIIQQYLTTVKPMHYQFVEPTKALADIVINNAMNEAAVDFVKTKIEQVLVSV